MNEHDGAATSGKKRESDRTFLLLLGFVYMFNFVDRTLVSVAGEAIRRELHLSDLQLGLLGGLAFSLFFAALGIPLARLAERYSRVLIIASVTAIWSAMTALTGFANSFAMLLICRVGVAIGEAGFTPALVSMLSDRFSERKRAGAFSAITFWVPLGAAISATAGGWIAQHFGWRWAFIALGLPGLAIALLVKRMLTEPPRLHAGEAQDTPPFSQVLRRVGRSPSFLYLTAGSGLVAMVGFGLNLFMIPLLVRRYGLGLAEAGLIFALSFSIANAFGTLVVGRAADALGQRDIGWFGKGPAVLLAVTLPMYLLAILQDDWRFFMGFMFVAGALINAYLPAIMTVTQRLVEPRMRASAAALHSFGQTVGGLGLGSVTLGYLSDRLAGAAYQGNYAADCRRHAAAPLCEAASATGLQHALIAGGLMLLPAIACYIAAARSLRRETRSGAPA